MESIRPIYLAGQTASGKSAVALHLAERLGGEIISVDSMQVYRGMNIGTAKPTPSELKLVRHHLLDVAELSETFSAANFAHLAEIAEADIRSRGKIPIYCGGTGFYFKALLEGISPAPAADQSVRHALENTPVPELLKELAERDPVCFEAIDRMNLRRVIRALEVIRLTGKTFSSFKKLSPDLETSCVILLRRESGNLRERINQRIDEMLAAGLVNEVTLLADQGLRKSTTAREGLGYREILAFLDGNLTWAQAVELLRVKTWQFSRRQSTYFKSQLKTDVIEAASSDSIKSLAEKVEFKWINGSSPKTPG